jgi:hypothetical protein
MGQLYEYSKLEKQIIHGHIKKGWLGSPPTKTIQQYTIIGGRVEETREVVVHRFTMGDVEDPDLYAAQPLWEWQNSEIGQWVMAHAAETPSWHRDTDPYNYGYVFQIRAKLTGARLTEWLLKAGINGSP